MNLFRSEEHVKRWLAGRAPGAPIPGAPRPVLAATGGGDRLTPGGRPHTREQNQAILDAAGLTGDFWRLP